MAAAATGAGGTVALDTVTDTIVAKLTYFAVGTKR
ncbi:hypothetical protein C8D81_2212 [Enemella evansiae]|nr:hypothetical protein C8D81_2212 [Enemella evansiae]